MDKRLATRRYRLGLRLFTSTTRWLAWWLIGGIALLTAVYAVFWDTLTGDGPWIGVTAVSILQWFIGVSSGVWLYTLFPVHLATGLTRREVTVAFIVFGALATLASAAVATAVLVGEHSLLGLLGAERPGTRGEALASGARYLLVTPIYFFAGAAVSAAAMRLGARAATAAIVIAMAALIYSGTFVIEFDLTRLSLAAWAAGAVALIAALIAVFTLSLRSIPLRGKGA